ncbi:hypothetical protein [Pediococcus ethanolidurans]
MSIEIQNIEELNKLLQQASDLSKQLKETLKKINGFEMKVEIKNPFDEHGSQEHSVKSNDGKDTYSKEYITSSNLMVKDDAKRYSFCNKNINASLVANNTEATISLCANDGVKNLLLKRDYLTVKDDAKMKKVNAENIKSGEIGISFDSNGTAIINAKKIKLNGVNLQSQAHGDKKYLHLAAQISDLQGQMAELQDKLSKLSN